MRIELRHHPDGKRLELNVGMIVGLEQYDTKTRVFMDTSRGAMGYWNVLETITEIRALEAAAKGPPAEWRKHFRPPLQVARRPDDSSCVGIVGTNGQWLDICATVDSPDAALFARMVECVNKCEAEKA